MKVFYAVMFALVVGGCAPLIHEASLYMVCVAHKDDPLPYNHCEPTEMQRQNMEALEAKNK